MMLHRQVLCIQKWPVLSTSGRLRSKTRVKVTSNDVRIHRHRQREMTAWKVGTLKQPPFRTRTVARSFSSRAWTGHSKGGFDLKLTCACAFRVLTKTCAPSQSKVYLIQWRSCLRVSVRASVRKYALGWISNI